MKNETKCAAHAMGTVDMESVHFFIFVLDFFRDHVDSASVTHDELGT